MRARRCGGLLLQVILLALTACGPVDFSWRPGNAGEALPSTLAKRQSSIPSEATATLRQKVRREMATESYCSALNLLRKGIQGGMPEEALGEDYGRAINGVLMQGELYLKQAQPEKAGELFRSAQNGFPKTETVAKKVNLTSSEILTRIEDCATELMERGLAAYRSGDLDGAIRTWKSIHAFNPRHQASRKAMKTAEVQRDNLEKVAPPK